MPRVRRHDSATDKRAKQETRKKAKECRKITRKSWSMGGGERSKGKEWAQIDQVIGFFFCFLLFLMRCAEQNAAFGENRERRHVNAWFWEGLNEGDGATATIVVISD